MKKTALLLAIVFAATQTFAQNCALTITGHTEDLDTREKLAGATIHIVELNRSIITDNNGDFSFKNICAGNYKIIISHVSCDTVFKQINLTANMHIDVDMPHYSNTQLQDVTVTTHKAVAGTGFKQELKGRTLDEAKGQSFAEALSKINGVTLLQTGSTISKPVIHGLHSNRILTINNGVRQEGQQWGNEHAPEIDPFIADNLVVIKGVDELKYGSDAIGGVILINTKPLRRTPGYDAELNTVYFSNNNQYVGSAMFEQQLKALPALTYRVQGTYKRGANISTPDYRLNNTALEEINYSAALEWRKQHYNIEAFYSEFNTKTGIFTGSHVGNLTDLLAAIDADKPASVFTGQSTYKIGRPYQDVLHRLLKLHSTINTSAGTINLQAALQYNHRQEYDIIRGNSSRKGPQLNLEITTASEEASYTHPKIKNFIGTIGITAMQQQNAYNGRYFIPNYNALIFGGYAIEKWIKHEWELQGGIRYDNKTIDTRRVRSNGVINDHDFAFSTIASSLNGIYTIAPLTKVNLSISLSQRAPYVNELLSDGIHDGTGTYEQGDINLKTEKAVNIAAGFTWQNTAKNFTADINLYSNHISNFIYQQPKPDEPVLTIAGAFPKIKYQQTNARLQGIDVAATYNISQPLSFTTKASLLRARNLGIDDWLISMPSDRFTQQLNYNFLKNGKLSNAYISLEVPSVLKQTRVPDDKNGRQDYKAPPTGYTLVNLNAAADIKLGKMPVNIGVGAKNIFNKSYREYLDGFRYFTDEIGTNISVRLKFSINSNKN